MRKIALSRGEFAKVDDEDYEKLSGRSWHCSVYKNGNKYARAGTRQNGKCVNFHMHRVILNPPADMDVDHINGDGLDNRKANLRICTRSQNHMNRKPYRRRDDDFKGVSYCQRLNKWQAYIVLKRKTFYIGGFNTLKEAALAYNKKAIEIFGQFARLNVL